MANAIELAKSYVPKLDEVYKLASLTAMLDGASDLARQGANANELIIPMMTMDGLADYSRNSGYVQGDVTLTNETVKCNFDRGRRFTVDTMDDLETAGLAFGRLSAEFIRTKVVPELDAFRFAAYCGKTGVTKVEGALADGSAVLQALRAASTALDEAEVPLTERYLFITPSLHGMVQDLDTTKSREVLNNFAKITDVPQTRFYTAIKQLSGASTESAGGYTKGDGAAELNFMVIHKPAVIQYTKHTAPKIIEPPAKKRMPNKRRPMTDFNFYSETYCGSLIPADAWDAVCRDAEAQMNRYERIYHVSYPQTGSRNMAVCAMAEALYEFAQLQDAGGAVQSVSVGNVSENRAAVAAPDTSAAAQAAELYRRAGLYADIYRGC